MTFFQDQLIETHLNEILTYVSITTLVQTSLEYNWKVKKHEV